MRQRPRLLVLLSFCMLLFAIGLPLQAMWIYGHGLSEIVSALFKLTFVNWLVFFGFLASSILSWRASPWLRFALPLQVVLVGFNNLWVGYYATDYPMAIAGLATLGFSALTLSIFFNRTTRFLISHPDIRWWLRAERKRMSVPVFIEGTRLTSLKAETFDISESGVFVPSIASVGVGDRVDLRINCGALAQIRCQGAVVRRGQAKGSYPAGVGIQFTDMSRRQRRELRHFLARQSEASL